jgi:hypothetical protein
MPDPVPPESLRTMADLIARHATPAEMEDWVLRAAGEPVRNFLGFTLIDPPPGEAMRRVLAALAEEGPASLDRLLREVWRRRELQRRLTKELETLAPGLRSTLNRPELDFRFSDRGEARASAPVRRALAEHGGGLKRGDWFDRLHLAACRVCRIERDGAAFGSGFAVGPRAVLTAGHVAAAAGTAPGLVARFGFRLRLGGRLEPGHKVPLAPVPLIARPPTAAEARGNPDPQPAAQDLDYALMATEEAPEPPPPVFYLGEPLPRDPRRGWLTLPSAPPRLRRHAPFVVIQYPGQKDLSVSEDQHGLADPEAQGGLRLRYLNLTAPGSSGSPGLTLDLAPVALHHFGDGAAHPRAFRQGVPLHLIRADIAAAGLAGHLGT